MAKATIVKISSIHKDGVGVWWNDKPFRLTSFMGYNDNLKVTTPSDIISIQEFAEFIVGCFESRSTFYGVASITFTYQSITTTVHRENAKNNPKYVIKKWENARYDELKAKERTKKFLSHLNGNINS